MVCFSCSHLAHNSSRRLCNQSSLCYVTLVCCWWMIPSMFLNCWGFLVRELWVSFIYIFIYMCPVFPLGLWWAFWEETSSNCLPVPEWRWLWGKRGRVELEIYGLEGDWLMPSLALMYGWQSPPPNPSHLLTHTHTHATIRYRTQLHIHPDTAQSPRPFLTVPQSCCMLSCSRQTAVFSALPFFCCP